MPQLDRNHDSKLSINEVQMCKNWTRSMHYRYSYNPAIRAFVHCLTFLPQMANHLTLYRYPETSLPSDFGKVVMAKRSISASYQCAKFLDLIGVKLILVLPALIYIKNRIEDKFPNAVVASPSQALYSTYSLCFVSTADRVYSALPSRGWRGELQRPTISILIFHHHKILDVTAVPRNLEHKKKI